MFKKWSLQDILQLWLSFSQKQQLKEKKERHKVEINRVIYLEN